MENNPITLTDPSDPVLISMLEKYGLTYKRGDILLALNERDSLTYFTWFTKIEGYFVKYHEKPDSKYGPWLQIVHYNLKSNCIDPIEWKEEPSYTNYEPEYFNRARWTLVTEDLALFGPMALDTLNGGTDNLISRQLLLEQEDETAAENTTAIMGRSSKEGLEALLSDTRQQQQHFIVLRRLMDMEVARRLAELDIIRKQAYEIVAVMHKKIERIMRTITVIELYLGVDEELHQLRSGESAPINMPITFRQLGMYMDEEVAVRIGFDKARKFDFESIKIFDEWLLEPGNLDYVLPEQRSICIFKPRRKDRKYDDEHLFDTRNTKNKTWTYFLIRDGENLHRIYTSKLIMGSRLFPKRTQLEEMFDKVEAAKTETEKSAVENEMYVYRKLSTFLQGLLDRTTVFGQLPEPINLYNLTERTQQLVNFVYDDDDNLLTDGRVSFKQWMADINSTIEVGSRILMSGDYGSGSYVSPTHYKGRLFYYCNDHSVPDLPSPGIYNVEKPTVEKKWERYSDEDGKKVELIIRYNPGGKVWGSWGSYDYHERKNRISWAIHRGDRFLLHYDAINMDDVLYYLHDRQHRRDYNEMLPTLEWIIQLKKEEAEAEQPFIRLVLDESVRQNVTTDEATVKQNIAWWKTKNKYKRAITVDDAKALRMIIKQLKKA